MDASEKDVAKSILLQDFAAYGYLTIHGLANILGRRKGVSIMSVIIAKYSHITVLPFLVSLTAFSTQVPGLEDPCP